MIGERLFDIFAGNKDTLSWENFFSGVCRLFAASFEDKVKLVFEVLDCDSNNFISIEEVTLVLSHVPLDFGKNEISIENQEKFEKENKTRAESQEQIKKLVALCMGDKAYLSLSEFLEATQKITSDIFLSVFMP